MQLALDALFCDNLEINFSKSQIIVPRCDRYTPLPATQDLHGLKIVEKAKYLGICIEDTMKFDVDLQSRRALEKRLQKASWILHSKNYSGSARY